MSYLEQLIRSGAEDGIQINLWPCEAGFQGNVKERGGSGWTVATRADPVDAVVAALSAKLTKLTCRPVVGDEEQIDLEDAIAESRGAYTQRMTDQFTEEQSRIAEAIDNDLSEFGL